MNPLAFSARARRSVVLLAGAAGFALASAASAQVVTTCPAALETTQLFSFTGTPQVFTVPANVESVRIIAVGADGGERVATNFAGGAGARIEGTFAVTPGNTFTVLVGEAGVGGTSEAGGGGASGAYFGTSGSAIAVLAGGGGGDDNTGNGGGGSATLAGGGGGAAGGNDCNAGGAGGTAGAGGSFGELPSATQTIACQTGDGGAGGGGFNAPGGTATNPAIVLPRVAAGGGGRCSIAGAPGGPGAQGDPTTTPRSAGVRGGFGLCGGGGADHRESGGGGGYSGGGGGPEGQFPGGGGSFVAATATATSRVGGASGGGSGRNGSVRLCYTTRADLQITKTNTPASGANDQAGDTVTNGSVTAYAIVVSNNGGASAHGAVVRDPPSTGLNCASASCGNASNGAVCPAVTGAALLAALQSSAGVTIPTLPATGSLTFTLNCTVQ